MGHGQKNLRSLGPVFLTLNCDLFVHKATTDFRDPPSDCIISTAGGSKVRYVLLACRHGSLFFPIIIFICLSIAGQIGGMYGVPNLFLDDSNPLNAPKRRKYHIPSLGSAIFEIQVYATSVFGLIWISMLLMEEFTQRRARSTHEQDDTTFSFVAAVALLSLAPLLSAEIFLYLRGARIIGQGWPILGLLPILGTLAGIAIFCALAKLAPLAGMFNVNKIYCVLGMTAFVLTLAMLSPITFAAKHLFIVVACAVFGYLVIFCFRERRAFSSRNNYTVAELEEYYKSRRSLSLKGFYPG
jgi:hypothetical protein